MVNSHLDQKAKVIIISGFLGSGKTTLLQEILRSGIDLSETVVVVNEFGKISVDGLLLKDAGSDVVELASGCVCCTLRIDLIRTLRDIWNQLKPRYIFIEATGVADPDGITEALRDPDISPYMQPSMVITVMDCEYWEGREVFGPVFYRQLEKADIILLNKVDLVEENKVAQVLHEIHEMFPDSRVIPTVFCKIDLKFILGYLSGVKGRAEPNGPHLGHEDAMESCAHGHEICGNKGHAEWDSTAGYVSFFFDEEAPIKEDCFRDFIHSLPFEVFRVKGTVRFPDRTVMVNYVGGKGDWQDWGEADRTRLAFVGWKISPEEVLNKLKSCVG